MHQQKVQVCCQECWYILPSLSIELEHFKNDNPVGKKSVQAFKVAKYDESYTLFFCRSILAHALVVKAVSQVT